MSFKKTAMERNEHKKKTPQDTLDAFHFVDVITNSEILRFDFKVVGKNNKRYSPNCGLMV